MWQVKYRRQVLKVLKSHKILSSNAKSSFEALHMDLEFDGPTQSRWPNYSKLKNQGRGVDKRHCHLIKGKPTFVACWEVLDKDKKVLEVYYV